MITYIIHRLIQGVIVLVIISIIIFLMMRLLPGDPALLYVAQHNLEGLSEADLHAIHVEFGLDKPLPMQYVDWAVGLLRGDFGNSLFYYEPVGRLLARCLPVTIHLGILAFILSTILGILSGLVCALRWGGLMDTLVTSGAIIGISAPNFWLGILMIYLFGLYLNWLPICGYTSPFQDFWLGIKQLIMPVLCLSLFALASACRQTRSSMLEVVRQDYIRTAWSKGLTERTIVIRHALKNGLIPVITLIGVHVAHIFGGSVFIETVFNIPGMGRLLVRAIMNQDYPVVQGICIVIAAAVVVTNLAVDICYGWLDPKVRYG
jgi:peptide/nickel transport system permease protein